MPFLHLPSHPDCIPTMFHVKMLFLAAQNISIESSKIIQKPQEKNSLRESTQLPVLFHPLHCYQILVSHSHPCPAPGSLVWKPLCKTCSIRAPDRSSGVPSSPLMLPFPVLLLPFSSGFEHLPGGRAPSTELETSPRLTITDRFRAPKALCVCGITAHPAGCSPAAPVRVGEPFPEPASGALSIPGFAHPHTQDCLCQAKNVLPPPPP